MHALTALRFCQGRSQGGGVLGPPNPSPLNIKDKTCTHYACTAHYACTMRIRLILWMSWMNWELRSISCYELVGYFWATACTLVKKISCCDDVIYRTPLQSKILATPIGFAIIGIIACWGADFRDFPRSSWVSIKFLIIHNNLTIPKIFLRFS